MMFLAEGMTQMMRMDDSEVAWANLFLLINLGNFFFF